MDAIQIVEGLSADQRDAAAMLLLDAFAAKLAPLVGRGVAGQRALAASLRADLCLVALQGERLVGLCGLGRHDGSFMRVRLQALVREHGWPSGLLRWVAMAMGRRHPPRDTLYIDDLAVAADWRGGGIGTRLLMAAVTLAKQQGQRRILLDVVDTNPRARALYERLGWRLIKTQRVPWPAHWLGFGAVTILALELDEGPTAL